MGWGVLRLDPGLGSIQYQAYRVVRSISLQTCIRCGAVHLTQALASPGTDMSEVPPTPQLPFPFERFLLTASNDALDAFLNRWPPNLIFRLRSVNSTAFFVVESYCARIWHPSRVLYRFTKDVRGFLHTRVQCDGVVSGSQAVQLMSRSLYPTFQSDLDVFLPPHGVMQMGRWLKRHGYVYQASGRKHTLFDVEVIRSATGLSALEPQSPYVDPASRECTSFTTYHFTRAEGSKTVPQYQLIQLVVVQDPVQYILNNFHSSKHFLSTHDNVFSNNNTSSGSHELFYRHLRCFFVSYIHVC